MVDKVLDKFPPIAFAQASQRCHLLGSSHGSPLLGKLHAVLYHMAMGSFHWPGTDQ